MLMMVSIALLVASQFFVIGVVLALWSVYNMLIQPVAKKASYLLTSPVLLNHRRRALAATGLSIAGILAVVLVVPMPSSTRTEGVVWAPEHAQVRAGIDGFIVQVLAEPGAAVKKGQVLVRCVDPELEAKAKSLRAQLDELDARYGASSVSKRVQADVINEQRTHIVGALALAQQHQAALQIRSPSNGTFVVADPQNMPGRYVQRGEVLAYVVEKQASTIRVVVGQAEADVVRKRTRSVEVRAAGRIGQPAPAFVMREVPAATDDLPSLALSLQGGGKIGLDPSRPGDSKALEKLFVLDLEIPHDASIDYLGTRTYVRFELEAEPLADQWYREVRRLFLKKFNV